MTDAYPILGRMIQTPEDLAQARRKLGLTCNELACALRLHSDARGADGRSRGWNKAGARVREMEAGTRPISGPVAVAIEGMLAGYLPDGFERG